MKMFGLFAFAFVLTACGIGSVSAQTGAIGVPLCKGNQLALSADSENGNFNGMSHSGTLLILKNKGSAACKLEAFPDIAFNDNKGPLQVTFTTPGSRFMHPGPVMVPSTLLPGKRATATMRWVSSPVYDPGVCLQPTSITLQIGSTKLQTSLSASVCGANATSISVEKTRFVVDPATPPKKQD